MNILAIDYGIKKIGFAIWIKNIALPLKTINNLSFDQVKNEISQIIIDEKIELIVIGIPLINKEIKTEIGHIIYNFFNLMKKWFNNIDIKLCDESYSTKHSISLITDIDKTIKQKKLKKIKDQNSALDILNSYISNHGIK